MTEEEFRYKNLKVTYIREVGKKRYYWRDRLGRFVSKPNFLLDFLAALSIILIALAAFAVLK